ncbi:hypothetical protein [Natranaerofaba carboxydovora]|uniref:hypothetical protein n=1 Tax=Natranaerofaba carboxydovora TaxID=2742683 RepID=UPI001F13FE34|nr:hypothetical protein [Natranaerofaba carboxydovora]UMZ72614.1 hypothetical protein ACONDI_00138 [Natranaerofaba carboxydovora]
MKETDYNYDFDKDMVLSEEEIDEVLKELKTDIVENDSIKLDENTYEEINQMLE